MSYRSIKTVLGETSLERKCRFLFGASLLVLIATSFWWYGWRTEKMVNERNRDTCRLLVDQVVLTNHWKISETDREKGNLDNKRGPIDDQYLKLIDFMVEKLSKQHYRCDFIQPYGDAGYGKLRPPRDAFEREARERFLKNKPGNQADAESPEFAERPLTDEGQYEYYEPILAVNRSCIVACHAGPLGGSGLDAIGTGVAPTGQVFSASTPPLSEGDIIAIAKVTIPTGPTQHKVYLNRAIFISTAIITVFLAMVTSYVIVRYVIVKPLRHLRDVSDSVSRGNIALRADIHTGDEFEELAVAFNRMLRHLVTTQEELRQVNATLDGKVDELAQANMRLYEMNTVKSDFLATMSHELRTPLNSILGFSEVLDSIASLDEKQKRYVQNIQKSGRTLLEMINDILDLAKMESGKMDIRLTDFRVSQVVGAQCDMARPLTEKKNIDMEACIPADLPPMRQDQARVQQILNNLLSNAIKFTPEGGRITVSVARDDENFLLLQVSDTGVGIAEEDQQTIFEKFRQARAAPWAATR